jgi:hypothetical protein
MYNRHQIVFSLSLSLCLEICYFCSAKRSRVRTGQLADGADNNVDAFGECAVVLARRLPAHQGYLAQTRRRQVRSKALQLA